MRLMNKNDDWEIDRIIRLMQTDDSDDAPPDAIRWSKNIFLNRAAAPKKSVVERVLAVLQMDLSPHRAAFGERSASASQEARQMLFQAGDASIDLRIKREEKYLNIQGQILGEDFAECSIAIFNENFSRPTRANELSEFKFDDVLPGTYNLSLQSGAREIVIENLELD